MNSGARVSVVIPLHNGAKHIAETLQSVAAQTHPAYEVIVIDDASTDDSVEQALASSTPVTMLRQANGGVSSARNAGLAQAQGDFVCFLDQDDVWFETHLERQLRCFVQKPELGAVVSPYLHWYPADDGNEYPPPHLVLPEAPSQQIDSDFSGWIYHQFMLDCWALTSATLLRRSVLQQFGTFDPLRPYGEDWDLWLRLSMHTQFAKLNWPPVLYRQHPEQGSRRARPVDHRCELLLANAARHGLASRDGRSVPRPVFNKRIARYETEFGYHHLQHGDTAIALRSLKSAWARDRSSLRPLLLAVAASLGWRPRSVAPVMPRADV